LDKVVTINFPLKNILGGFMKISIIPIFLSILIIAGCSSLVLKPGDFAWPIESALKVDNKGVVHDERYNISLNVKDLLFAETQDSVNVSKVTLRVIRDVKGYYFITASKFKNVYVFEQIEGGLKLAAKILVAQNGLNDPALNQRTPNIQLVSENNPTVLLSKDGLLEGAKK
jgi:hypothetical protein